MKQVFRYLKFRPLAALCGGLLAAPPVLAQLPSGLQVAAGRASLQQSGAQLTVTNSNNAILNWNSFSIGAGNSVRFVQPGSSSQVLNRVTGSDPSSILGSLSSNGHVWLLNPNGVLFGSNARVDVAGLVASTLNISNGDWLAGHYLFSGGSTAAAIDNQGQIRTALGGQVALIGGSVSNEGIIEADNGQIMLAAGQSVELVDTGAPNLAVKVAAPSGSALNLGSLQAGRIDVMAAAVNQDGLIQAERLSSGPAGEIVLQAGDRLTLAGGSATRADGNVGGSVRLLGSEIDLQNGSAVSASGSQGGGSIFVGGGAQGQDASIPNAQAVYVAPQASLNADALQNGDGGHIVVWSDVATRAYGRFSAHAGANGGNGGLIETSGHWLDARPAALDVSAPKGLAGTWLLDPYNITISDSVSDSGTNTSFTATGNDAQINSSTIVTALNNGTNVTVSTGNGGTQAGTITVDQAYFYGLAPTNPVSLTLSANSDITVTNSSIYDEGRGALSLTLRAGTGGNGGAISVSNSNVFTNNGAITLGGIGTGGAAVAHDDVADAVHIDASTLDAGTGALTVTGQSAVPGGRGVWISGDSSATSLNGGNLTITGVSTASPGATGPAPNGVEIDGGKFSASQLLSVTGTSTYGSGLVIVGDGTTSLVEASVPDLYGNGGGISLNGTSLGGGYGVMIDNSIANVDSPALLQTDGPNINITGSNAGTAVEAVYLYGGASGGNLVSPVSGADVGPSLNINASGAVGLRLQGINTDYYTSAITASSSSSLVIEDGYLSAQGLISLQAKNVILSGTAQIESAAFSGTAIMVSGPGGTGPAQTFNNATTAVSSPFLLNTDPDSSARWIIWLNDATAPGNLALGESSAALDYDFQRYGAKSSSAWANDIGNGVITYVDKVVTLNGDVASKIYDGTTTASVSNVTITPQVSGDFISGYFAYDAPDTGNFVDKNAGTGKKVILNNFSPDSYTYYDSGYHPVYGYTFVDGLKGDIARAVLHADVTGANKIYDGTTNAVVNITNITGLVGDETVSSTGVGSFLDKNVGQAKPIDVAYSLGNGANGGLGSNYLLQPNGPVTANITPATLSYVGTVVSRPYDGTTNATVSVSDITGLVGNETVSITGTGSFADKNVGQAKPVAVNYTLGSGGNGWLASNYQFKTSDSLTGNITPALLSATVTGVDRVYDGTTDATVSIGGITGLVGSETVGVAISGSPAFADKNVGQAKPINVSYALSDGANGGLASNYQFQPAAPVTASITPAALTYTATPVTLTVGVPLPVLNGTVTGFIGGDTLETATTGSLSFQAGVADTSVAGVYAINGQGLSALNYDFTQALSNALALTIDAIGPNGPLVQAQISALPARNVGPVPPASPNPRTSGLLDLTPPVQIVQGAGKPSAANFDSVAIDTLSPFALSDLLKDRASLMDSLLHESLEQLRKDPTLADVGVCATLKEALQGTCLVTEAVKAKFNAERARLSAAGAAAPAQPAGAPVAGAAPELPPPLFSPVAVKSAALPEIRRKVAVLIGEGHYGDARIPALANTVGDAHAVAATLTRELGYETLVLDNPSKETLIGTLNRLALEIGPEDSAVVFYAGHGAVVEETGAGYWLASSSQSQDPKTWLSNADIGRLIEQIGAKQVVLISDSCYSGSLVAGARIRGTPGELNPADVLARRSAVVMSSGGNEPVFDSGRDGHSLFAWSLMNTLSQVKSWRPGGNLFERIRFTVARELPQRPQYGAAPGYQEGGDYLFEVRQLDAQKLDAQTSGGKSPG